MRDQRVNLLPGDNVLHESVQECRIEYDLQRHRVRLSLIVAPPREAGRGPGADTMLTIYVKKDAAVKLLHDLTNLSDEMTWGT
jgi:hypothetical protein